MSKSVAVASIIQRSHVCWLCASEHEESMLRLNSFGNSAALPEPPELPPPYYDVSGNGILEPLDALRVINAINGRRQLAAEGEAVQHFLVPNDSTRIVRFVPLGKEPQRTDVAASDRMIDQQSGTSELNYLFRQIKPEDLAIVTQRKDLEDTLDELFADEFDWQTPLSLE